MISLRSFSLVMSIVLLRQLALQAHGPDARVTDPTAASPTLHGLIGGCVLFCVIGKFLPVWAMFRADVVNRKMAWQEMERKRLWLEWLWLVAQGWLLANTGAADLFARTEHSGVPAAIMLLLWFSPTIVFYSSLEFGFTQLECLWSRSGDVSSAAHWTRWCERIRLGNLGQVITCIMPVVVLLGLLDLARYLWPTWSQLAQAAVALVALLALGLACAPLALRLWYGARAVSPDQVLFQRLEQLCRSVGTVTPRLYTLGDGQTWQGVALVGWTPWFRQIWIGPGVVQALTAEQLDMVLLHELAHLKRGHCWWRIIPILATGASCMALMTTWPFETGLEWAQVIVALAFAVLMMWMLCTISQRCELDADLQACRMAVQYCTWADGQPTRAVSTLSAALQALHDPQVDPARSHWLHPSLVQRIAVKL